MRIFAGCRNHIRVLQHSITTGNNRRQKGKQNNTEIKPFHKISNSYLLLEPLELEPLELDLLELPPPELRAGADELEPPLLEGAEYVERDEPLFDGGVYDLDDPLLLDDDPPLLYPDEPLPEEDELRGAE